jgi:hypothetical protein
MIHALYWFENTFNPYLLPVLYVLSVLLFVMICFVAVKGTREPAPRTRSREDEMPSAIETLPSLETTDLVGQ